VSFRIRQCEAELAENEPGLQSALDPVGCKYRVAGQNRDLTEWSVTMPGAFGPCLHLRLPARSGRCRRAKVRLGEIPAHIWH
jgi:hypothetical protein